MAKGNITERVMDMALPMAEALELTVYEVEYKKEGTDYVLRVILDTLPQSEKNIGIDDCETISRQLSDALDRLDFIDKSYMLEVTSPGIDRPLKKPEDYARFMGSLVDVGLYKAVNGAKVICGTLTAYNDGNITITPQLSDESMVIEKEQTAWVKLAVVF